MQDEIHGDDLLDVVFYFGPVRDFADVAVPDENSAEGLLTGWPADDAVGLDEVRIVAGGDQR